MSGYASASVVALSDIIAAGFDRSADKEDIDGRLKAAVTERYQRMKPASEASGSAGTFATRVAYMPDENAVPFAGIISPENPTSGVYGGMSLIWFPVPADGDRPASSLLTFVCGTRGLAPDEQILGRPGHARHLQALGRLLSEWGVPGVWVKQDPTNLSQQVPQLVRESLSRYSRVFERYGNYIYAAVEVPHDRNLARMAVGAFLDCFARERGWTPLAASRAEFNKLQDDLRARIFPRVDAESVVELLKERRFVILQGPPGTGKTRLAKRILEGEFGKNGLPVQFHPAVTYESFVAGIAPQVARETLAFSVKPGYLAEAILSAESGQKDYLLMIDEVNRADLSRILGEAIYLFEPADTARTVRLPQPLPDGRSELSIPKNLYVLGTMNSADRSIAILDLAVRRRFAFVDIWPDASVVQANCRLHADLGSLPADAFGELQDIFAQYAPEDALVLLPGHSYFLAETREAFARRMRYELVPLLREYLIEGRLGMCEAELRAYLVWLEGELVTYVPGS